ncbi:hypothetical protein GU926_09345 [Nibribacter ruber]|uniref:Uncharacterized protein n=1 Tax=Nibribacter ruber TaxID=2698458 RepID=A0A6P1P042_9BACT|nr:hypothetical protein [Nibribacter ruber]QHL87631.1 hypothetical protein GU926_09345 [Nibribacter ruber]
MNATTNSLNLLGWAAGLLLMVIGVLNLFLVHPVPGIAYFLLSLLFFPPANALLKRRFDFSIPVVVKIILFVVIMMFTLGVSDLGDMLDKW